MLAPRARRGRTERGPSGGAPGIRIAAGTAVSAPCPVYGFDVVFRLHDRIGETAADALWDAFVAEAIERHGLVVDGRRGRIWRHTIRGEAGQATEADRVAVSEWAAARDELASHEVGPLVDVGQTA